MARGVAEWRPPIDHEDLPLRATVPFVACLLLVLGACAPRSGTGWINSSLPQEQWAADYTECKRDAERIVGWRDRDESSPLDDYDRNQARKQFAASLNYCMRDRGYVPARRN